jgi:endonuclease YncB( thermonuclease family)
VKAARLSNSGEGMNVTRCSKITPLSVLALLLFPAFTLAAQKIDFPTEPVTVARVIDGDTFAIEPLEGIAVDPGYSDECKYRVRLIGLDTPERGRLLYEEASDALEELLPPGTTVYLEKDRDERDGASPWRWLAYVRTDACDDVGEELLRKGLAVAWRYQPNVDRFEHYRHLMYEAFRENIGLFDPTVVTDEGLPAVYVASDQEDCYHRPNCEFAARILEENFIAVYRAQNLETCGKSRCSVCLDNVWLWGD